jgi:2,3-bisphosphoglycerate-independent phosphoglycerate mutase
VDFLKPLLHKNERRILLIVADGLGGAPGPKGLTELEQAKTPNLNRLACVSSLGLTDPIGTGITPGSGPAHFALFGYNPIEPLVGRGVLEALGCGMEVRPADVCIRANFCTFDYKSGRVTDRRAGRLPTRDNQRLVARIQGRVSEIDGVRVMLKTSRDYRFAVVLRGKGLRENVTESDPQENNLPPAPIEPMAGHSRVAARTASIVRKFLARASDVIRSDLPANYILLRGFSRKPLFEPFAHRYGLRAACVANYPAYRGVARLLGMDVLPVEDDAAGPDKLAAVRRRWQDYAFFFVHLKQLDKLGEDGDFAAKVREIRELDRLIPTVLKLEPDVFALTGDHSTPSILEKHSWHPNPFLLWSPYVRQEGKARFTERDCARGQLGRMPAREVMPLLLANAGKLKKFGA